MTFFTQHPLDRKADKLRLEFYVTLIMAVTDQAALFATGAFHLVELDVL